MAQDNKTRAPSAPPPSRTLRLTFAYDENGIRLLRSQSVEMIAPPSVVPPPPKGQAGYWFEVRDAKGELVHHRPLHDPVRNDLEVFSDDPKQSITRVPNPNPRGEFTVLVPDLPDAAALILMGPPMGKPFAPSVELLRYSFDQLRRR